jgi:polysaccharide biosynthesis/export protein
MNKKSLRLRIVKWYELFCSSKQISKASLKNMTSVLPPADVLSAKSRRGLVGTARHSLVTRRPRTMNSVARIGRFMMLCLTGITIAGCSLESAATNPSVSYGEAANVHTGGGSSDSGSLQLNVDSLNQESIISPGDKIEITVWGYPEFNTTTTVKSFGTITVPLIGEIIAGGLTVEQLKDQLKQRLSQYVKGDARVTISHIGIGRQISVLGAVSKQGNYPAITDLPLVGILADAGGTTSDADLAHIKIFRRGIHSDAINVNLTEYLRSGNIRYIPRVGPGDMVFIPEQPNFIKDFSAYAGEVVFLFGFFTLLR